MPSLGGPGTASRDKLLAYRIGAAGVGTGGLMQTDVILLQAERLMARASSVILLVDSSKFRQRAAKRCAI